MVVVATLKDGRIIARTAITAIGRSTAGEIIPADLTVTDLRKVEYVLSVNLIKANDAGAAVTPHGVKLTNNIVGLTVYASAGCTISGEVLSIGF